MKLLSRLIFAAFTLLATGGLSAQEAARVILILDASGSMWGKVEGRAKIEIAREVVRDIVSEWNPSAELGLMVYGHRSKGDCDDIELLIPPAPVNKAAFIKAVQEITPKGKTPLSDAVLQAAEALRFSEEKATVILVSDGMETCGKDPCAVAEQLEAEGIDFTAHVVGFDLSKEEQDSFRCLADKTGGVFLAASDADSLKMALATAVEKTVEPTPTPAPESETTKVTLKTLLSEGGEVVQSYFVIEGADAEKNPVARGSASTLDLKPGTYKVTATYKQVKLEETIEVPKLPETEIALVYGAGVLKLKTFVSEGGEEVDGYYTISFAASNLQGKREQAASGSSKEYTLSVGKYLVTSSWGSAVKSETEVEIKKGELTEATLVLNAGILKLKTSLTEGGENVDAYYVISGKAKLDGSRPRITAGSSGEFQLPAGVYHVESKWGSIASAVMEAEVKAGEATTVQAIIPAGLLKLSAKDASGTEITPYFTIYSAAQTLEKKRIAAGSSPQFQLPVGEYTIEATHEGHTLQARATIKAGEATEVSLKVEE